MESFGVGEVYLGFLLRVQNGQLNDQCERNTHFAKVRFEFEKNGCQLEKKMREKENGTVRHASYAHKNHK